MLDWQAFCDHAEIRAELIRRIAPDELHLLVTIRRFFMASHLYPTSRPIAPAA
jgi:hypothetical protein